MEAAKDLEPWFGVEQEYFLMKISDARPLGFPEGGEFVLLLDFALTNNPLR
jgi:hypothetical protein